MVTADDKHGTVISVRFDRASGGHDIFHIDTAEGAFPSRVFEASDVDSFDGDQILPIVNEAYGARVVYGTPYDTAGVPDAGSPGALLASGLLGTAAARRWVIRG